jgi:hypothetical protein
MPIESTKESAGKGTIGDGKVVGVVAEIFTKEISEDCPVTGRLASRPAQAANDIVNQSRLSSRR